MKKALSLLVIIISFFVINNLIHTIYSLWKKQDLVVNIKKDLQRQRQENQRLKGQLSYVQSQEFIEEQARNKLFLVKPSEQPVLMQQPSFAPLAKEKPVMSKDPHWRKWWKLFF